MKTYKIWYILGLLFMGLFCLSSLSQICPIYILLSLISFIISSKYYTEKGD